MNNFKWIVHIPLIGGLPIGTEQAFGKPPEFVASLPGFWNNDSHYMNYQNETLGRDIRYDVLEPDDFDFREKINLVVSTPPCAALSRLNPVKDGDKRGATGKQNDFMYITTEQAIKCYDADVIMGENAPALYTTSGNKVAEKIARIAKDNGYSMSLYKTNTSLHGIPQNRCRTFYILWKNKKCPILNWYKEDKLDFSDYLRKIPDGAQQQEIIINGSLMNEPYYSFMNYKTNNNTRKELKYGDMKNCSPYAWVFNNGYEYEMKEWLISQGGEYLNKPLKRLEHAIYKKSIGMGAWDSSVRIYDKTSNAIISRNMTDMAHPNEDRSLTIREAMYMMGLPHDFILLGGKNNYKHIAQNVPVCTAKSLASECKKYLEGKLELSDLDFIKQDNIRQVIDTKKTYNDISLF